MVAVRAPAAVAKASATPPKVFPVSMTLLVPAAVANRAETQQPPDHPHLHHPDAALGSDAFALVLILLIVGKKVLCWVVSLRPA
jgi:hypothetical protein